MIQGTYKIELNVFLPVNLPKYILKKKNDSNRLNKDNGYL